MSLQSLITNTVLTYIVTTTTIVLGITSYFLIKNTGIQSEELLIQEIEALGTELDMCYEKLIADQRHWLSIMVPFWEDMRNFQITPNVDHHLKEIFREEIFRIEMNWSEYNIDLQIHAKNIHQRMMDLLVSIRKTNPDYNISNLVVNRFLHLQLKTQVLEYIYNIKLVLDLPSPNVILN